MDFFISTYGNFDDFVRAMQIVTRIIASPEFRRFLAITLIISVLIGTAYMVASAAYKGGKANYMWGVNIALGVVFCFVLIFPTADNVVIEDKYYGNSGTAGYFVTIKNVPFGIALMAWFYSYTQEAMIKMITLYGSPVVGFEEGGSDISYKLITGMDGIIASIQATSPASIKNIKDYINDCVYAGVALELINMNDLSQPGPDGLWKKMKLPNVAGIHYTTLYNGAGTSCNDAHTAISNDFKEGAPVFNKVMADYCQKTYIAADACTKKFNVIAQGFFNKSASDFMMTYFAATATKNVVESYLELADKQTNISNVAAAIQAEKWLPKIRNATFIVVLLLAPVCFLLVFFAPGAVMRWYGGMYVWLILWGSVDQLIFVLYQYELLDLFQSMRSSGLGITQVLDINSDMLESMSLFGKMRWMSMGLSLGMCVGILKIGNHAMSGIA
jgi:hypothetical protein